MQHVAWLNSLLYKNKIITASKRSTFSKTQDVQKFAMGDKIIQDLEWSYWDKFDIIGQKQGENIYLEVYQ
jgi:hypothetical protein